MKITTLVAIATATVATTIALPPTAHADPTPPCSSGQVQVSNGGEQAASGHRELLLMFSLAAGAGPCTLTGYPGVDSGTGGPLIHADRTMSGFMGGIRAEAPPTVSLTPSQPAYAVVEGVGFDITTGSGCPTYTDLRVTPPDTTQTITVPAGIDTCELQIHPVGSEP
jgi:Protein of unknown function (DUF4232)